MLNYVSINWNKNKYCTNISLQYIIYNSKLAFCQNVSIDFSLNGSFIVTTKNKSHKRNYQQSNLVHVAFNWLLTVTVELSKRTFSASDALLFWSLPFSWLWSFFDVITVIDKKTALYRSDKILVGLF